MKNYTEEFENKYLASYAMKSCLSKGRRYKEKEHSYRSCYQRDRDRVIHSAAFRRLEYKTQVFVNYEGDYYRTRLTHTLEVAQIARTIASSLRLNSDLVEAVALAHDLGHTPFGHSGEEALNELMKDYGGFNHNLQGLRTVDTLEERYPEFPGLNLSWEVREGIVRHSSFYDKGAKVEEFQINRMPTLETQIVDIADEIAYNNHDLDDGLTSGLLDESGLNKVELWNLAIQKTSASHHRLSAQLRRYQIIRVLIDLQVTNLINETQRRIRQARIKSINDVLNNKEKLVAFSPEMMRLRLPLKDFLMQNLYQHYRVIRMSNKARRFIGELFNVYMDNLEQLPKHESLRLKREEDPRRIVCDYIAGMTDRCALDEYKKLFDPYEKV